MTRYIYLLECEFPDKSLYKIGISNKVERRVKQLQTGNPYQIKLLLKFKTPYAFKIEAALHREHKIDNVNGEWFDIDISNVENRINTLHKGFDFLLKNDNDYFKKEFDKLKT